MFSRTFRVSLFLFVLCLVGMLFSICHVTNEDKVAYKQLEKASLQKKEIFSKEIRKNVEKEVFLKEKGGKKIQIFSPESELFFIQDEKDLELIEELKEVTCTIVEENNLRHFKAKEATFNYSTQALIAKDVTMWTNSEDTSYAEEVECLFKERQELKARKIKMELKK